MGRWSSKPTRSLFFLTPAWLTAADMTLQHKRIIFKSKKTCTAITAHKLTTVSHIQLCRSEQMFQTIDDGRSLYRVKVSIMDKSQKLWRVLTWFASSRGEWSIAISCLAHSRGWRRHSGWGGPGLGFHIRRWIWHCSNLLHSATCRMKREKRKRKTDTVIKNGAAASKKKKKNENHTFKVETAG